MVLLLTLLLLVVAIDPLAAAAVAGTLGALLLPIEEGVEDCTNELRKSSTSMMPPLPLPLVDEDE